MTAKETILNLLQLSVDTIVISFWALVVYGFGLWLGEKCSKWRNK